jgi:glycyl-tRNA synthetase beta chain
LAFVLADRGLAYLEIAAALGAEGGELALRGIASRAEAVRAVRGDAAFVSVAQAAKRIANITRGLDAYSLDAGALALPAERELGAAATSLASDVEATIGVRDFDRGLRRVAELAAPLDRFFVDVLVMDKDEAVKRNRIALLQSIHGQIVRLADLSQVVVDRR